MIVDESKEHWICEGLERGNEDNSILLPDHLLDFQHGLLVDVKALHCNPHCFVKEPQNRLDAIGVYLAP